LDQLISPHVLDYPFSTIVQEKYHQKYAIIKYGVTTFSTNHN